MKLQVFDRGVLINNFLLLSFQNAPFLFQFGLFRGQLLIQRRNRFSKALQRPLLRLAHGALLLQFIFQLFQLLLARFLFVEFRLDLGDAPVNCVDRIFEFFAFVGCTLFVCFPNLQPKDTAQHVFALAGRLLGEQVGLALQKERGIDERFIIQPQGLLDACLSLARTALAERAPLFAVLNLKFQNRTLAARQCSLYAVRVSLVLKR